MREFLDDLPYAFVVLGNPSHDRFCFGVIHIVGNGTYFLGSESPIFWIVQLRSHLTGLSYVNCVAPIARCRYVF